MSEEPRKVSLRPGLDAAAAAHDGALGEDDRNTLAGFAAARRVVLHRQQVRVAAGRRLDLLAELVGIGDFVDQPELLGALGAVGRAVDDQPHCLSGQLASRGDGLDELAIIDVEHGLDRLARGRGVLGLGVGFAGALVGPDVAKRRFDAQLVESAAKKRRVGPQTEQVELAGRSERDRFTGGGEVISERPVAALAGGFEIALGELACRAQALELAAQLLRFRQPESGILDVHRHATHPRIGARGAERAIERRDRGRRLVTRQRQLGGGVLDDRAVEAPDQHARSAAVEAPAGEQDAGHGGSQRHEREDGEDDEEFFHGMPGATRGGRPRWAPQGPSYSGLVATGGRRGPWRRGNRSAGIRVAKE